MGSVFVAGSAHRSRVTAFAAWVVGALLAVLAPLVGCGQVDGSHGAPLRLANGGVVTSVAMVGDSITYGSFDALDRTFRNRGVGDPRIEGQNARRIGVGDGLSPFAPLNGLAEITNLLAEGVAPDVWVIELGTNDLGQYATAGDYAALIDSVLALLAKDAPLVWVDVYHPKWPEQAAQFNELLRSKLAARSNAAVAEWNEAVAYAGPAILQVDGLHPNAEGSQALADLVIDAIGRA